MSGDVYLFSGANAHTVLCVGERPSLAAYESFVNLNVRYISTKLHTVCERTHVYLRSVSCAPLSLASAAGARAVQESPCARLRMRVCAHACVHMCVYMRVCAHACVPRHREVRLWCVCGGLYVRESRP